MLILPWWDYPWRCLLTDIWTLGLRALVDNEPWCIELWWLGHWTVRQLSALPSVLEICTVMLSSVSVPCSLLSLCPSGAVKCGEWTEVCQRELDDVCLSGASGACGAEDLKDPFCLSSPVARTPESFWEFRLCRLWHQIQGSCQTLLRKKKGKGKVDDWVTSNFINKTNQPNKQNLIWSQNKSHLRLW